MKKALVFVGLASPALYALFVLCTHWVAVPYWDDWGTPGEQLASCYRGTLTLAELFSQHNEHRRFVPRLIALAATSIVGWDVRYLMAFTFAFVCAGAVGLYALLLRTIPEPRVRVATIAAVNLLLFSPRLYEAFLTGNILGDIFVPAFGVLAAARVNLSTRSFRTKTLINAALALVSTYTFGNGMLVWLLAWPIDTGVGDRTHSAPRVGWRTAYFAAAAVAISGYLAGYRHPPLAPPTASLVRQPGELLIYLLTWIGNLFFVSRPALLGAAVLSILIVLSVIAILRIRRDGEWRPHYPWLLLAAYVIISGGVAARARLALGYDSATHYRYTVTTVFAYIAIAGLCASLYSQRAQGAVRPRIALTAIASLAAAMLILWIGTFWQARELVQKMAAERRHLQLAMRWSDAIPTNPDLTLLSPYATTLDTIRTLAAHDALRPRLIGKELAGRVSLPPPLADDTFGSLERVQRGRTAGELVFDGWTNADCVVIGCETADGHWRPLAVTEARRNQRQARADARAEFKQAVNLVDLPPGTKTFRAWGIDLVTERASPLAGAPATP